MLPVFLTIHMTIFGQSNELYNRLIKTPSGKVFYLSHSGSSMEPTLKPFDLLEVISYNGEKIQAGDIVLFFPNITEIPTVHRIVKFTSKGFITRGDKNIHSDKKVLLQSEICGLVTAIWRGQNRNKVIGGKTGLLLSYLLRQNNRMRFFLQEWVHILYTLLSRSGIFRQIVPYKLRPRIILFSQSCKNPYKLMMGKRFIGQYDNQMKKWKIHRPFKLFINESLLPSPN